MGLFGFTQTTPRTRGSLRARAQVGQVDVPRAVVGEAVGQQLDAVRAREVLEQRIARARHEHAVARITEQPERERISLARAAHERDLVRAGVDSAPRELFRDRAARLGVSERVRLVACAARIGERREQRRRRREARRRGVALGEVEQVCPARARRFHRARELVGVALERRTMREHRAAV